MLAPAIASPDPEDAMLPMFDNDLYKYAAVAILLLAILLGYWKGRDVGAGSGRSRRWTQVPLIAFAIVSLGPSALAVAIYLGYASGLMQPPASGYRLSSFVRDLPLDFAVINWPFVALYLAGRLRPDSGSGRAAMWTSVAAMALPNILLFALAPTMLSTVFDAGQGIGVIEAVVMLPVLALLWPAPTPAVIDVLAALASPVPLLGLVGWLVGHLLGGAAPRPSAPARP